MNETDFAYKNYGIDGVTTNPKHIKMSGKPFMTCVKDIAAWIKENNLEGMDKFPVSFEINPIWIKRRISSQRPRKWLPTAPTT